jgi:hypothetical protein
MALPRDGAVARRRPAHFLLFRACSVAHLDAHLVSEPRIKGDPLLKINDRLVSGRDIAGQGDGLPGLIHCGDRLMVKPKHFILGDDRVCVFVFSDSPALEQLIGVFRGRFRFLARDRRHRLPGQDHDQ